MSKREHSIHLFFLFCIVQKISCDTCRAICLKIERVVEVAISKCLAKIAVESIGGG